VKLKQIAGAHKFVMDSGHDDRAIYTQETGKEEGWILKIVNSGPAGSFDPLFKTETSVRTTRWRTAGRLVRSTFQERQERKRGEKDN
jgi:hypothetical protein